MSISDIFHGKQNETGHCIQDTYQNIIKLGRNDPGRGTTKMGGGDQVE